MAVVYDLTTCTPPPASYTHQWTQLRLLRVTFVQLRKVIAALGLGVVAPIQVTGV